MSLNIKLFLIACFFFGVALSAQELEANQDDLTSNKGYGIYIETSGVIPTYYGNNFMGRAYSVSPGINMGLTGELYDGLSFHFDVNLVEATVERPELVGTIATTAITRISFGAGYSFLLFDKMTFIPSAHFGYVKYGHTLADTLADRDGKTRDDGAFLGVRVQFNYPLLEWLELTAGAQNNFDFLATQTAPEDESFFSNALSIVPSVGLRFKLEGRKNN